jgi:hypothetical protein
MTFSLRVEAKTTSVREAIIFEEALAQPVGKNLAIIDRDEATLIKWIPDIPKFDVHSAWTSVPKHVKSISCGDCPLVAAPRLMHAVFFFDRFLKNRRCALGGGTC